MEMEKVDLKADTLPVCANCTYKDIENGREIGTWLLNNKDRLLNV